MQHTAILVQVTMTAYCRLVSYHVPLLHSQKYFMQLPVKFLIKYCCNLHSSNAFVFMLQCTLHGCTT
ncbi:hypothetical protein V5799_013417 [Amblyomma americanum]|uniref:Uncharacterized protein n=1 Tax=Amblyomma americanum TaxID=6943 RepID=A0AAQ4E5Z8_AMBAM